MQRRDFLLALKFKLRPAVGLLAIESTVHDLFCFSASASPILAPIKHCKRIVCGTGRSLGASKRLATVPAPARFDRSETVEEKIRSAWGCAQRPQGGRAPARDSRKKISCSRMSLGSSLATPAGTSQGVRRGNRHLLSRTNPTVVATAAAVFPTTEISMVVKAAPAPVGGITK